MKKLLSLLFLLPTVVRADMIVPEDPGYGFGVSSGSNDVAIIFVVGIIIAIIAGVVIYLKNKKKK